MKKARPGSSFGLFTSRLESVSNFELEPRLGHISIFNFKIQTCDQRPPFGHQNSGLCWQILRCSEPIWVSSSAIEPKSGNFIEVSKSIYMEKMIF